MGFRDRKWTDQDRQGCHQPGGVAWPPAGLPLLLPLSEVRGQESKLEESQTGSVGCRVGPFRVPGVTAPDRHHPFEGQQFALIRRRPGMERGFQSLESSLWDRSAGLILVAV